MLACVCDNLLVGLSVCSRLVASVSVVTRTVDTITLTLTLSLMQPVRRAAVVTRHNIVEAHSQTSFTMSTVTSLHTSQSSQNEATL